MKQRIIPILCTSLFLLYIIPLVIRGEDSYITIHDNLDSIVANRAVLASTGHILNLSGDDTIPQIMNGLPRSAVSTGSNIVFLLFGVFNPFTAYLINHILVHLIAFVGMVLLLNRSLDLFVKVDGRYKNLIVWGVALAFGVLPFYTMYGLSIAGLPLLLYAFLNLLKNRDSFFDYLIMVVLPFWSNLLLSGIFAVVGLFIILIVDGLQNRRLHQKAFWSLLAFSLVSVLTEYDLIRSTLFNSDYVSHRADWDLQFMSYNLSGVVENAKTMFFHGQYHASSHHEWALITTFVSLVFTVACRQNQAARWLILKLLGVQLVISLIYGFYFWERLIPIKEKFGLLSSFNLSRFHWLSPFIWYFIFFLSLILIAHMLRHRASFGRGIIATIIAVQVLVNISYNSDFGHYVSKIITLPEFRDENITYRQFYSEKLFNQIEQFIGLPQEEYRIVNIGIHPSIAQYNGFFTLDSYQSNYPLFYKQQFRRIIEPELAKSPQWQAYFDSWGSRCYIFSSEVPDFLMTTDKRWKINHLDLNMAELVALGGRFIFSAVEIGNHTEEGLVLLKVFEDPESVWKIFLYEIELINS